MKDFTLGHRAGLYHKAFPKWPPLRADDRWIDGMWILGNDYKNKTPYYGAYPPNYLKRVGALFPDVKSVLHLFSGSLEPGDYTRFDMRNADVTGDVHHLASYFPRKRFDLTYADPPYSQEDAVKYGACMIKRNVVLAQCAMITQRGGYIAWLDQVLPMFRKAELQMCGVIGIVRSTNHRFRVLTLFRKL